MRLRRADATYQAKLFVRAEDGGLWHRWDRPPAPPEAVTVGAHVDVVVSHGMWIGGCPCGGAQLVDGTQDRYFCVDCLNEWAGGQWAPLVWPDNPDEIEAVLLKRPNPANMNWRPGETAGDLRAENRERGL